MSDPFDLDDLASRKPFRVGDHDCVLLTPGELAGLVSLAKTAVPTRMDEIRDAMGIRWPGSPASCHPDDSCTSERPAPERATFGDHDLHVCAHRHGHAGSHECACGRSW